MLAVLEPCKTFQITDSTLIPTVEGSFIMYIPHRSVGIASQIDPVPQVVMPSCLNIVSQRWWIKSNHSQWGDTNGYMYWLGKNSGGESKEIYLCQGKGRNSVKETVLPR